MTGPVLIRGGGEMATGVAVALFRAGMQVVVAEIEHPRAIRRTVAFAEAVYRGTVRVEGITARRVTPADVPGTWEKSEIAVLVDPGAEIRCTCPFPVLVDAVMSKRNSAGTATDWAPLVIGLGPGFEADRDCHLVVETQRGHYLGRVYDRGTALPDTGRPGDLAGHAQDRVVRATADGRLEPLAQIGDRVAQGTLLARIRGVAVPAPLGGVLRGLMADGLEVTVGEKIGDVDPRGRPEYCHYISDKARHIGAGVLAAVAWHQAGRPGPLPPRPRN